MLDCLSKMRTKGIIYEKSIAFSLNIIALCNEMRDRGEYIMSKQILKSSTSIGANYCEALGAESPHDFIHKVAISLKEANETYYWLDLIITVIIYRKTSLKYCKDRWKNCIK